MSFMVRTLSAVITLGLLLSLGAVAGQVDSPAAPGDPLSYMASLAELCARLDTGASPGVAPGNFVEPTTGPADNPVCNLAQALIKAPAPDDTDGAVAGDVLSGKTYWGLRPSAWGATTGTMPNVGQQNITPSTTATTISLGFHDGSGSVAGDADLVSANIRSGKNIFGVSGNSNVVDTSTGDAVAADIASGKKAWVDGAEVTGTATGSPACGGTSSPLGRWCDNGDGTVTDLNSGLVWLKKADWGGSKPWRNISTVFPTFYDDAHTRAGLLKAGSTGASLTDGSAVGVWRLPTKSELVGLVNGTERVRSSTPQLFTGVQAFTYWTSTSEEEFLGYAWWVSLEDGSTINFYKSVASFVWPVRGGQ